MDAGDGNAAVVGSAEACSSGRPRGCVFVTCCERTGSQSGVAGGHTSGSPWELVRRAVSCPRPRPTESESLVWQQAIRVSLSFLMSGGPAGLPESLVQETSEGVRGWVSLQVCAVLSSRTPQASLSSITLLVPSPFPSPRLKKCFQPGRWEPFCPEFTIFVNAPLALRGGLLKLESPSFAMHSTRR